MTFLSSRLSGHCLSSFGRLSAGQEDRRRARRVRGVPDDKARGDPHRFRRSLKAVGLGLWRKNDCRGSSGGRRELAQLAVEVFLAVLMMVSRDDQGRDRKNAEREQADAQPPDTERGGSTPVRRWHVSIVGSCLCKSSDRAPTHEGRLAPPLLYGSVLYYFST